MKIKYSPAVWNYDPNRITAQDTAIEAISENSIAIDGELYEFDTASVEFPDIVAQTNEHILEAHRDESGELYLTVRRYYTKDCDAWDTGDYHAFGR